MVSKKSSLVIAAIATILFFLSVAYVSCTKPLDDYKYSCKGVVCTNGGFCDSAKCICPIGFEGAHCETATVTKFLGSFGMDQKIIGSDSVQLVDKDTLYNVFLRNTATPTTFFLDNFYGDPFYSSIVCTIDSVNHYFFKIDTISRTNMVYDHYRILGGYGRLYGDSIFAYMWVRHLTSSVNWQNDTLELRMHRQ